ncbi:hypothetical protein [Catellatospora methionotrophica]|uniref:hypothetical protein n=1 Tax=Catellatospora methionotrophica TaxID=121620 RepID=UPI0033DD7B02
MPPIDPALRTHVTILRAVVGFFFFTYAFFTLTMSLALTTDLGWSAAVLPAFLGSAVLGGAIYLAAGPVARRIRSVPGRLYTLTGIRLVGAIMTGQFGMVFAFALSAGLTPYLLGAGATVLALAIGVWPRAGLLPAAPAPA